MLLDKGANVNANGGDNGWTALIYGAASGCVEIVDALLANGADVNTKDGNGHTALMRAARNGHTVVLQALLNKGANVNAKDNEGATALIHAVAGWDDYGYGEVNAEIVKTLLDRGADVSVKDNTGRTALRYAEDYEQEHIVELLR